MILQVREAYKDYMRQVATLLLRDANVTLDPTQTRSRIEQFVSDAYGQEEHIAQVTAVYRLSDDLLTLPRSSQFFLSLIWRKKLRIRRS